MPNCISVPGATFLGCSVIDFNASAGWGAQTSEVTINIVEDCLKNESFEVPVVGSAKTFKIGSFDFTGLVQSWNSKGGSGGNPVYSVKLISPAPILEHSQVILDHYEGKVPFANVFNVYGFLESLAQDCPLKVFGFAGMGAPAGGFGSSMKTDRGIPWQYIKQGLQALTGGWATQWTAYGGEFGYKNDDYVLDLSDLPDGPISYRIAGPVVSISDLINQVCEDAGCDYYIKMVPYLNVYVIKVVVIARNPTAGSVALNTISNFVADESHSIISKAVGRELRSEVNNFMIIGGRTKQYYQCTDTTTMTPFWGWDVDGKLIASKHIGEEAKAGKFAWQVYLDFRKINIALAFPMPDRAWIGENELRAALGDFESFIGNITQDTNEDSELYKWFKDTEKLKKAIVDGKVFANWNAAGDIRLNAEADDNAGTLISEQLQDGKILYNWLNSYVSDFYGKQFLVGFKLPGAICKSIDTDTGQVIYSDVISSDGGWTETPKILGLPNGTILADQFKDDIGKVQPMVSFTGQKLNTKTLDPDDYVLINNVIWIKATIEDKWVLGNPIDDLVGDRWRSALVTINAPIIDGYAALNTLDENARIDGFTANGELDLDFVVEDAKNILANFGGTVSAIGPPAKLDPIGIGIPLLSNTQSYGPWYKAASTGPGSVQVEVDDGLAPWEYGSIANMNNAGLMKVDNSVTSQQSAERGEITVPGIPTMGLATNINSEPPSVATLTTRRLIGTNVQTTFYIYPVIIRGGAVISNISVSAGAGGVTTTYTINNFTPVFGRFTRGNADRLKQIGLNRLKGLRDMRARGAFRNLMRAASNRSQLARQIVEDIGKNARGDKSPTVAFGGKYAGAEDVGTGKQAIVVGVHEKDTPHYSPTEVIQTSFMTMDGFFRPVQSSTGPATYLPKVVTATEECEGAVPTQTSGPPPPVNSSSDIPISTKYLDFLANPDGYHGSELVDDDRSNSSVSGHNIAGVARGAANSEWGGTRKGKLLMQATGEGVSPDYNSYYRFLALRGPLMVHGWGYDINGKPIPNSEEGVASPQFKSTYDGLSDKFPKDWLQDPDTWPVAPVDLRFDRKRGVWTVPSAFRLYQITTTEAIASEAYGSAEVNKYKDDILDAAGTAISSPTISVENWTNAAIPDDTKALAYYDTAECKYWVIHPGSGTGPAGPSGPPGPPGAGTGILVGSEGCDNSIECEPLGDDCLVFGAGLHATKAADRFTVVGPKLSQDGACDRAAVVDSFQQLNIGEGLELKVTNAANCIYELTGPKIFQQGIDACGGLDVPVGGLLELQIGKGLTLTPTIIGCSYKIEGPRIANGEIDESFAKLTIGAGLKLEDADDCNYTLTAEGGGGGSDIKVGSEGCDNSEDCASLGDDCLMFGAGLHSTKADDKFTVVGPKIANGEIDESFAKLTIGAGLKLEGADCNYTLTAEGGGGGSAYTWKVGATTTLETPLTVSNGQEVKFVGDSTANMVPIKTNLTKGDAPGPHTVTISLEMVDSPKPFDKDYDIPISWSIENGKLKLFVSREHIESC